MTEISTKNQGYLKNMNFMKQIAENNQRWTIYIVMVIALVQS